MDKNNINASMCIVTSLVKFATDGLLRRDVVHLWLMLGEYNDFHFKFSTLFKKNNLYDRCKMKIKSFRLEYRRLGYSDAIKILIELAPTFSSLHYFNSLYIAHQKGKHMNEYA